MHWKQARWLLLSLFLVGYVACQKSLGHLDTGFLVLTIIDAAACSLLLARLGQPLVRTLWAWIALLLLLDGYFARMYWFVYQLNHPVYINHYYPELRWVTRDRILAAYPWASVGFVVFCVAAAALVSVPSNRNPNRAAPPRSPKMDQWTRLVLGVFLLYLLASLLQIKLGFGVRGAANASLPFRLGTVLSLFREEVVPSILVLAAWVFDHTDRRWATITLFFLFVSGVLDALLSTSRAEVLLFTVPVFFLWAITGRFTRTRKWALAAVLVTAAVLVPIVSSYRSQLESGTAQSATPITPASVAQGAFFLSDRAGTGGIEAVWYSLDHKGSFSVARVLTYLRPYVFTNYYTESIVGVQQANDYRSSGMFGAFVIIGGATALILLTLGVVVVLWGLFLLLRRLRVWPVAFSLGAVAVSLVVADPTGAVLTIPKLLISVVICEWAYVRLTRRPAARSTRRAGDPAQLAPEPPVAIAGASARP